MRRATELLRGMGSLFDVMNSRIHVCTERVPYKQFVTSSEENLVPLTAWCLVAMVVSWTDSRPVLYMTGV